MAVVGDGDTAHHAGAALGLFSLVTVFADGRMGQAAGAFRQAAWYRKRHPTFADALAMVRKELWAQDAEFLRLAASDRHDKRPQGICGTTNRGRLLCGMNG